MGDTTDVGAYRGTTSFHGTFDQGDNVSELNDALFSSSFRGLRGGNLLSSSSVLVASFRPCAQPGERGLNVGIRVASIPEPSSLLYGGVVMLGLLCWKWFAS